MCCQSEVELVHKKLGTMEGVVDVKVNLMLRRVAVTHDAERASAARLLRAASRAARWPRKARTSCAASPTKASRGSG